MKAKQSSSKTALKLVSATSMTIFSLLSVFTATAAWFDSQRNVHNDGDNMQIYRISSCLTGITFHAQVGTKVANNKTFYLFEKTEYASINVSDNTASQLTFNASSGAYQDWLEKDDRTATLSTYSLLSQDHPILILFNIAAYPADNPSPITLDFKTNQNYLGFESVITQSGNPLSSIVEFHCEGLTTPLPSGGSFEGARTYADTYLYGEYKNINYDKSWVTIDDQENVTFDADKKIRLFSNLNDSGNPRGDVIFTQIAVVMNYSIPSLEYIYNRFLGNEILDNDLYFNWDWTMEI